MRVETFYDDCAECPLENWSQFFKFFSCSKRYYTHLNTIQNHEGDTFGHNDFDTLEEIEGFLTKEKYVWVKVYMYSHSGDTISSKPFNCRWDSGCFGYLYATKKDILECFCGGEILTKKFKDKALQQMINFIDGEWCAYIEGETYGFNIVDDDDEVVDSYGGYYGEEYAMEAGEEALHYFQNKEIKKALTTQSTINYLSALA